MDVVGSVTLQKSPKLMQIYRTLLQAEGTYGLALSSVMGCENLVCVSIPFAYRALLNDDP